MPLVQNQVENHRYLSCQLKHGAISALVKELKTRLDRSQLDKETPNNCEDNAACCLFNDVLHIYNRINIAKRQEEKVVGNSLQDNVKDVLDGVMEYEPCETLPDMDNHLFDDEPEDDEADNDVQDLSTTDSNKQLVKPCLMDLTRTGWEELNKLNVQEVRQHAKDCLVQKCDMTKYIMMQVIEMKSSSMPISIYEENVTVEQATWLS
jgi:hypothetical protein